MAQNKAVKFLIERSCLDKKNLSKQEADRVVDWNSSRGKLLYYYKCDFCQSYHMTRQEPNNKQKQVEFISGNK